jgi:hypothetical protein
MQSSAFPLIRLHPAAYEWLKNISSEFGKYGTPKSMTSIASEAVLSIPMPNGHGPAQPGAQEEKSGE